MLLVVLLFGMAAALLVYGMVDTSTITLRRDKVTAAALAQAKQALIGRAFADSNRPGSLPCPDTNNDGSAESPIPTDCPSYIGRLPWRTLGLPDLRDGSGERLWYAVSREFARNPSNAACLNSFCPLNTDNKGQFTITGTAAATDVIAIVFSAGSVVAPQVRDTANENNVVNYLEGGNETGITTLTFTADNVNDRLLAITGADIWPLIEKRAASEILANLQAYRLSGANWCACYPWADISDGVTNEGRYYGRVPLLGAATASTPEWGDLGITIPSWLKDNNWPWVFFYTVSDSQSANHGPGNLTVDSVATSVVLITSGASVTGDNRPKGSPGSWNDGDWVYYVDDTVNSDLDAVFITPTPHIPAYAQDRLYKL